MGKRLDVVRDLFEFVIAVVVIESVGRCLEAFFLPRVRIATMQTYDRKLRRRHFPYGRHAAGKPLRTIYYYIYKLPLPLESQR